MNTFSDPRIIVEQLPLFSGQKVADFGAGTGAYTFLLASRVAGNSEAAVYAIDVQKNMVEHIAKKAKHDGLSHVHAIWGDIDDLGGSRLRSESVHMVVVANVMFLCENKKELLKEVHRVLVPGGELVLVDWSESFGNIGPAEASVVNEQTARLLVEESGFNIDAQLNAGEHHYGFIAFKNMN